DDPGDEVDPIALHVAVDGLLAGLRVELIVGHQHFDGQVAELAAQELHRELEAVARIDSGRALRPGERRDEADLDPVGGVGAAGDNGEDDERKQLFRHCRNSWSVGEIPRDAARALTLASGATYICYEAFNPIASGRASAGRRATMFLRNAWYVA